MAGLRIQQDIFIPEDPGGVLVPQLGIKLPKEVANNLPAYAQEVRRQKKYAMKINEGQPNEEMTVKAVYHICRHDAGEACDPPQEI